MLSERRRTHTKKKIPTTMAEKPVLLVETPICFPAVLIIMKNKDNKNKKIDR